MKPALRITHYALLIALLVTTGFGCRKPTYHPYLNMPDVQIQPNQQAPTQDQTVQAVELAAVQKILQNFSAVDSFHADMTISSRNAISTGRIDFERGVGMHGSLTSPNMSDAELYLTNTLLLFRAGTSTWMNLAQTTQGAAMTKLLQQAFSPDADTLSTTYLSGSTKVTAVEPDPSGCILYRLVSQSADAPRQTNICAHAGLPTRIESYSNDGKIEIRYSRYHQSMHLTLPH